MRVTKSLSLIALIASAIAGGMDVRPANAMMALQLPQSRTLARAQQHAPVAPNAFTDINTMLFPFYKADSLTNDRLGIDLKPGLSNKMILPTQEPGEMTVFFKGHITREELVSEGTSKRKMNLVLRVYDQAQGGKKLYEGIHEVYAIKNQYFTAIQIPSESMAKLKTVWLEAASTDENALAFEPRYAFNIPPVELTKLDGVTPAASTSYYVKSVALCTSCGGDAPFINGAFSTVDSIVYGFGSGCGVRKDFWDDAFPYVCVGLGTF